MARILTPAQQRGCSSKIHRSGRAGAENGQPGECQPRSRRLPKIAVTLRSAGAKQGVDVALEGESLLVIPGNYPAFTIDGKSVQVFVRGAGKAIISGKVRVKNLAAAQFVVLSRLEVRGAGGFPSGEPALDVSNVSGHLRVQDSNFKGQTITNSTYGGTFFTGAGVRIDASLNVVFSACSIEGGNSSWNPGEWVIDGGSGLDSVNSSIALYDCQVHGGDGSWECVPRGGDGGAGYRGSSFGLFAAGTTLSGGTGGGGDYVGWNPGGKGGNGLLIDAGQAHLLEDTPVAGPGGWPDFPVSGAIVALNGSVIDSMLGTRRKISLTSVNMDDASVPITITGQPGDSVFLIQARKPSFVFKKPLHGTWMVPSPYFSSSQPAGTIGSTGTLVIQRTFDIPDGTLAARLHWLQAICVDTTGQATLTGPAHVLSLE
ncbi:MAG: hypothetical protein ABI054_12070 [Planctomycetota bacterium]